jgi:hypothetical protein
MRFVIKKDDSFPAMQRIQKASEISILTALIQQCRTRFLRAAQLLEHDQDIPLIYGRPNPDEKFDLEPIMPVYEILGIRFRKELYTGQIDMLEDVNDHEMHDWTRYAYHRLLPALVDVDSFARNLMQAIGMHPCKTPHLSEDALVTFAAEMELPSLQDELPKIYK